MTNAKGLNIEINQWIFDEHFLGNGSTDDPTGHDRNTEYVGRLSGSLTLILDKLRSRHLDHFE